MSEKKVYLPNRKPKKELTFPCLQVKLVPTEKVIANDYNPNEVAREEMNLLAISIEEDGVTQPVVTYYDAEIDRWITVDGFHRRTLIAEYFKSPVTPVVEIEKPIGDRMASTIRHNRARGKHKVDLMSEMVTKLLGLNWTDSEIARYLGMDAEEVLRLKQMTGLAGLFKNQDYGRAWMRMDDKDLPQSPHQTAVALLNEECDDKGDEID